MQVKVPLLGKKSYPHDLSRQGVTTHNFGFVQPLCVREMVSGDHFQCSVGESVLLQPVVKPTFGRIWVKNYFHYVPIEDIYHPYASLLAGKTYAGAINSYIPTQMPSLTNSFLTFLCYLHSNLAYFQPDPATGAITVTGQGVYNSENKWKFQSVSSSVSTTLTNYICNFVSNFQSQALGSQELQSIVSYWQSTYHTFEFRSAVEIPDKIEGYDWYLVFRGGSPVVPQGIIAGRLTEAGKNLRKILIGCGIQLNLANLEDVSLSKIGAYYKAWFDEFAVQRQLSWKNTYFYNFFEVLEQSGYPADQVINDQIIAGIGTSSFFGWIRALTRCYYTSNPDYISAHIIGTALNNGDVTSVPYVIQSTGTGNPTELSDTTKPGSYDIGQPTLRTGVSTISGVQGVNISQQGLDVLNALYKYVNIKTAVGGRIRDFMRSLYGADYRDEKESQKIGSSQFNIDIGRVLSTAETSEGWLGEYAGEGSEKNAGRIFDYNTNCPGFFVAFCCIVPEARMAQGNDPDVYHLTKLQFYNEKFDAKTLLPTRRSVVYNTYSLHDSTMTQSGASFGNIPSFSEYKINTDILNGDISMPSTMANLLQYSLAKILPFVNIDPVYQSLMNPDYSSLVAGDAWRFVGLYRTLGNYDRIFHNNYKEMYDQQEPGEILDTEWLDKGRIDDNFIMYFYLSIKSHNSCLPLSESFQTDGFGSAFKVKKA